jgi:hypothetical protein
MRPGCWTSPGSLSCSPWQSVCHDWTATDATHNCMPGCENILAVTASWLICVCGFCLCAVSSWKSQVWRFLGMKELLNLLQRCWLGRAGPIPRPGSSCSLTQLDIFWSNVTEHIYIRPFGILLTKEHTEIKHVSGPALFLDFKQPKVVIPFWNFGITNQSHLQGSRCPSRTWLDSRQPAHTWWLLVELIVIELIKW